MSPFRLIISPVARNDLKNIFQFGLSHWGEAQSSKYIDSLKTQLWTLTEQPEMGIDRDELLPNLRSFPVERHIIFYRLEIEQIEVIRVLHGRQDPQRYIK